MEHGHTRERNLHLLNIAKQKHTCKTKLHHSDDSAGITGVFAKETFIFLNVAKRSMLAKQNFIIQMIQPGSQGYLRKKPSSF